MRRLLPLSMLLLVGCAEVPPFSVTLTNDGDGVTYLDVGTNGSPVAFAEVRTLGAEPVSFDEFSFCASRCGSPSGVGCVALAPMFESAFALLAGDSETLEFEGGKAWRLTTSYEGDCIRRTELRDPLRVTVCRSPVATDWEGDELAPPAESGLLDDGDGSTVVDPVCEDHDFDLAETTDLQIALQ